MIRRAGPQDVPFLRDMLRHAFYWRMNDPASDELPISRYVQGWGRQGDRAFVAIDDFQRVGAAWYRLFQLDRPGYGFVDGSTPELAIAVVPSRRGRGFGHELLQGLIDQALADEFAALSLSVDNGNPSAKLYERYGFVTVHEEGGASTMRVELTQRS